MKDAEDAAGGKKKTRRRFEKTIIQAPKDSKDSSTKVMGESGDSDAPFHSRFIHSFIIQGYSSTGCSEDKTQANTSTSAWWIDWAGNITTIYTHSIETFTITTGSQHSVRSMISGSMNWLDRQNKTGCVDWLHSIHSWVTIHITKFKQINKRENKQSMQA